MAGARAALSWGPFALAVLSRLFAALAAITWAEGFIVGLAPAVIRTCALLGAVVFVGQAVVRQMLAGLVARPVPDMKVVSQTGTFFGGALSFAASGMRGWRDAMEDAHVCEMLDAKLFPDMVLFAVLDGHGGKEVSQLASQLLVRQVEACGRAQLDANGSHRGGGNGRTPLAADGGGRPCIQRAMEDALPKLDALLRNGCLGMGWAFPATLHPFGGVGSTACLAAVDVARREVVCASAGDSRAFLIKKGKAVDLSDDHKPENPEERARIRGAGGQVVKVGPCHRVDGNLNLSRALGDFCLKANSQLPPEKQKVIAVPDSQRDVFKGGAQELLVVGCDGLFEKRSNQDVADIIWPRISSGMALEQVAKEVLHACCARGCRGRPIEEGTDNETVILVKFSPSQSGTEDGTLASGERVQIYGLESDAGKSLNGLEGIIEGPGGKEERRAVRLVTSGEVKSLKAANLRVVKHDGEQ